MTEDDIGPSIRPLEAVLSTRAVTLRAIEARDYARLRQHETASGIAFRWRHQGLHIPPEHYPESLWRGTLVAFVYERPSAQGEPLGLVSAYDADPRHGHCHLAAASFEVEESSVAGSIRLVDAMGLLIDYVFQGWDFRKLYFECAAYNESQIQSFLRSCEPEGRLRDHLWLSGRYWDLGIWSLSRVAWQGLRDDIGRWGGPGGAQLENE